MEVSTLRHRGVALRGPTPLLRLQGDDRLVALTRRGHQAAYEVLVSRYAARLHAFCRHMLSSKEDAEDVLQDVFAAAFNAMQSDERPINVRPWLYRIARNRCLNHLRRQQAIGVDSMDVHFADHGASTADRVHKREEFRELVEDVQTLPETQRTALLLREIDALSYEQIAEAMETTVPSIKSLLVRARVSLAEAAEARRLTCEEVREELGEVAEGLKRRSPPVRRHLRQCERCDGFDKHLRQTNRALAAMFPLGPLLLLKKFLVAQAGTSSAAGAAGGAAAVGTGNAIGAGAAAIATKAAAGLAAAAIVTAGAVEVDHARKQRLAPESSAIAAAAPAPAPAPRVLAKLPQPTTFAPEPATPAAAKAKAASATPSPAKGLPISPLPAAVPILPAALLPTPAAPGQESPELPLPGSPQIDSDTTALPPALDDKRPAPTTTGSAPSAPPTATAASAKTPDPEPEPPPAPKPKPDPPASSAPATRPSPAHAAQDQQLSQMLIAAAVTGQPPAPPEPAPSEPAPPAPAPPAPSEPAPPAPAQPTASPSAAPPEGASKSTVPSAE